MPFRDLLLVLLIATAWSCAASHVNDLRPSFLLVRRRSFAGSSRVVSTATRTCGGRRWLPGIPPSSSASASCARETSRSWSRSGRIWRREDESNAVDIDDASRSPPTATPSAPSPPSPLSPPSHLLVTSTIHSIASCPPNLHPGTDTLPLPLPLFSSPSPLPHPLPHPSSPPPSFPPVSVEVSRRVEHVTSAVQSVASRSPDLLVVRLNVLRGWQQRTKLPTPLRYPQSTLQTSP